MTVRRVVVDHVLFVVADLAASRGLYTAALAPLGYEELHVQDDCVSCGAEELDDFTICRGEPVTTGAHVAFSAGSGRRGCMQPPFAGLGRGCCDRYAVTVTKVHAPGRVTDQD